MTIGWIRQSNTLSQISFHRHLIFSKNLVSYWDKQGWARIGHQLEDLFRRLYSFLVASGVKDLNTIVGLMKYDYFVNHKYKPRKPWWEASFEKKSRSQLYKQVLENPSLLGD